MNSDDIMKIHFNYPVEELDNIILQIDQGIMPMISEDEMEEVKLRRSQRKAMLTGDDDDLENDIARQQKAIQKAIEDDRRKATKQDVLVMQISDDVRKQLIEDMGVSYVRTDPDSRYNIPDDKLYKDAEQKRIYSKLSKIRPSYYHPSEYIAAVKAIIEAVNYSVEHDYPWMSKQEAIEAFNSGRIKFAWGQGMPILKIGYTKILRDPEILAGIVNGTITVIDRSEDIKHDENVKMLRRRNRASDGIACDYKVIPKDVADAMATANRQGIDTPMDGMFNLRRRAADWSLPSASILNQFCIDNSKNRPVDNRLFDWGADDAADAYMDRLYGVTYTMDRLLKDINAANGGMLGTNLTDGPKEFEKFLRKCANGFINSTTTEFESFEKTQKAKEASERIAAIENHLMETIRANNPNL